MKTSTIIKITTVEPERYILGFSFTELGLRGVSDNRYWPKVVLSLD